MSNAFYRPDIHSLTVCTGFFTTLDGLDSVLAHELSHSLGIAKEIQDFVSTTRLAKELTPVWANACDPVDEAKACYSDWRRFKTNFSALVAELSQFKLPGSHFRSCLQYHRHTLKPFHEMPYAEALALVKRGVATMADHKVFYNLVPRVTKDRHQFLNPCGRGRAPSKNPLESLVTLFFTMEYRCRKDLPEVQRFKEAISTATAMQAQVLVQTTGMGGSHSKSPWMGEHGYAESSEERFADAMGYRVFARLLAKSPLLEDRRQEYLLNEVTFCSKGDQEDSDLKQAEHELSFEPHSLHSERRIENLIPEIRAAIQCEKDFPQVDCTY